MNPRIPSKLAPQASAFDLSGQPSQMFALFFAQVLNLLGYYFFLLYQFSIDKSSAMFRFDRDKRESYLLSKGIDYFT